MSYKFPNMIVICGADLNCSQLNFNYIRLTIWRLATV